MFNLQGIKKKCLLLFILIFLPLVASVKLFGMKDRRRPSYIYGFGGYGKYETELERLQFKRKLWEKLPGLKKRERELNSLLAHDKDNEDVKWELQEKQQEIKFIEAELGGSWGDIILRSIAGTKGWEMVEDLKVGDNKLEGFYKGIALRGGLSIGDTLGKSIDGYVGKLFDFCLGKAEDFISFIYRFIFRSSCKPFEIDEVNAWKKLVVSDLKEIEVMIKNSEKYDSRGRAEILREFESQEDESCATINLWQDFVEDVARTYEDLAIEIDLRQGYYEEKENGFGVVQCAQRLKNKLLKAQNWFLSVKSLKEFVNTPEVKSIIPSMKRSFENYFNNLADQIRPLNGKKSDLKLSSSQYSSKNRWETSIDDDDDDYPAFMR